MTLYSSSSTTHLWLVTKVHLAAIIHRRNNTILLPVGTLQRQTHITSSPVCLQTYLCFTPLKPKIPPKYKFIPYIQDNAASLSQSQSIDGEDRHTPVCHRLHIRQVTTSLDTSTQIISISKVPEFAPRTQNTSNTALNPFTGARVDCCTCSERSAIL